ncbi:glycosyltransferase family 2 protein [Salinibacterium sp. M195]|uniref:glycosyltransferase family 2 protein n=1 Tax=Salinibacterium sp. M195 TaxID=2583374 RepID=UPI001C630641|nr:glycosyltransferase family 2 protein [Salinibacterium sp. M195]QYH35600.1 glycosyltransferase family 2 protein [Salinibacterium sp. M195]
MPADLTPGVLPRVAVLLATHNGRRWLPEQLDSVLNQSGVDVEVFVRDDASTDGTAEWLAERSAAEPRLTIIASDGASGSAAANFYRLVQLAPADREFYAFCDQDDIWIPTKLSSHVRLSLALDADGVSSNVTSFTADGSRSLVKKDFPQRRFDYLLESPGPGSTFLLSRRLIALTRDFLNSAQAGTVPQHHDWLIYVLARAHGWLWHIDSVPTVEYRQHDANVMGANVGARSALSRLSLVREQWHRGQAQLLTRVAISVANDTFTAELTLMRELVDKRDLRSRFALARRASQLRRRPRDQWIIGLLIVAGVW